MMGLPCASFSMAGLRCSGACCADGALATMKSQAAIAMPPATEVLTDLVGRAEADLLAFGTLNGCMAKSPSEIGEGRNRSTIKYNMKRTRRSSARERSRPGGL